MSLAPSRRNPNAGYAGYDLTTPPPVVGGQPWAMPATSMNPPAEPGQQSSYQGLGNFGSDPFGYTNGSLLTPWTQPLPSLGPGGPGSGGIVAPNLTPFSYGDFSYNFRAPGGYNASQFATPDKFGYMNYDAPSAFKAPTADEAMQDPGVQAQLRMGTGALERSAALGGSLRTGGTLKALMRYGNDVASQSYDKVYGRRASEYDRSTATAKDVYTTNRSNAAENYDRNFQTGFAVHNANEEARRAGYTASSDVALRGADLGYNIATGTYDRNRANAKEINDSQNAMASAAAAAANATNERDYQRAMQQYGLAYDIFQNNQSNQFNRTMATTQLGMGAAGAQAGYTGTYGGTLGDLYTGAGNARAAGYIGQGNAVSGAITGAGNTLMDLYAMQRYGGMPGQRIPAPTPPPYYR